MQEFSSRTAITEQEALAILLGLVDLDALEQLEVVHTFGLGGMLDGLFEAHLADYRAAIRDKRPANVIAEKLAAVQHYEAMFDQADAHVAAMRDELNKGERSVLKVDDALSNKADTYITLHSFKAWAIGRLSAAKMPGAAQSTVSGLSPEPSGYATKPKPRIKLREQEDAILEAIRLQGEDPMALPSNVSGKAGVKAAVRESLKKSPLFEGKTTFAKAWERLAKDRRIVRGA